jgi:hypothetical protein
MDANKEILEIIKKNMPEQVGSELKKLLEKAEKDARMVEELSAVIADLEQSGIALNKRIDEYIKFDQRNANLDAREHLLAELELGLRERELEYKLAAEKEKSAFAINVAMGLVRNVEYRNSVFGNGSVPFKDNNGCITSGSTVENKTETKSVS